MERLEEINAYIEQIKIKSSIIGGFNKEAVYLAVKEISDKYETYLEELENKVKVSEARLAESRGQSEITNKEISELSRQSTVKDQLISSMKNELKQKDDIIGDMQIQLDEIEREKEEQEALEKEQKDNQMNQFLQLKQLRSENLGYMDEIVKIKEEAEQLNKQNNQQKETIEGLTEQVQKLEEKNMSSKEMIKKLYEESQVMKNEVENVLEIQERNKKHLGDFYLSCLKGQTKFINDFFEKHQQLKEDVGDLNDRLIAAGIRQMDLVSDASKSGLDYLEKESEREKEELEEAAVTKINEEE